MQRRIFVKAFFGTALMAALGGCVRVGPMQTVKDEAFIGRATVQQRTEQVKRAGASLSWIMEEQRPGLVRGTLNLRTHQAVVDIRYDESRFSINYVTSKDLDYRPDGTAPGYRGPVIHSNYNGWVTNLERRIVAESAI